jgi:hypothetical protein
MLLAKAVPLEAVRRVLRETDREGRRERLLPAPLMVYYVMALALYMQVSYEEVLRLVFEAFNWSRRVGQRVQFARKSAIAKARDRLGYEPLQRLYQQLVHPIASTHTPGAYYRQWRLVSLDGSVLDVGDTNENESTFGRPGVSRGLCSAFPQIRFCALVENGSHVLFGASLGAYRTGERTLARDVLGSLGAGMLCLADRGFHSFVLWQKATQTGADLLWRVPNNMVLPCLKRLADGSYLSRIHPSTKDRRNDTNGVAVRVVEYRLVSHTETPDVLFRLITSVLDPDRAPAIDLPAVYADRWEIEGVFDELKTHLRGRGVVLRSKTPDGVRQEFWGFLLAHFAVRTLMHDAALLSEVDPDRLSYVHAVATVRRKLPYFLVTPPSDMATPV